METVTNLHYVRLCYNTWFQVGLEFLLCPSEKDEISSMDMIFPTCLPWVKFLVPTTLLKVEMKGNITKTEI